MTKDEMKDRISMALKDSILQQGFEIICKENAELKKQNKELQEKKNQLEEMLTEQYPDLKQSLVWANERETELLEGIEKLKKENEQLKKKSEENQDLAAIAYMQGMSKNKAKLDKAKDIIKELLSCLYACEYDRVTDLEKAEAFLKECGE